MEDLKRYVFISFAQMSGCTPCLQRITRARWNIKDALEKLAALPRENRIRTKVLRLPDEKSGFVYLERLSDLPRYVAGTSSYKTEKIYLTLNPYEVTEKECRSLEGRSCLYIRAMSPLLKDANKVLSENGMVVKVNVRDMEPHYASFEYPTDEIWRVDLWCTEGR